MKSAHRVVAVTKIPVMGAKIISLTMISMSNYQKQQSNRGNPG
jgi:hypothetical protein